MTTNVWDNGVNNSRVVQATIQMHITADGLYVFPKDSPQVTQTVGSTVTNTASFNGDTFVQTITGVGTHSINDTGWVKQ